MVTLWDMLTVILGLAVLVMGVSPVLDELNPLNVLVGIVVALGMGIFSAWSLRQLGNRIPRLCERWPSLETHSWVFLVAAAACIVGLPIGTLVAVKTLLSVLS
jgi:hypothetical protein